MIAESLTTVIILAVIVEVVTNGIKALFPVIKGNEEKKNGSRITAALIGMILCVTTRIGILNHLQISISYPTVDYIITGIVISRGSNAVHDLISIFDETNARII